MTPILDWLRTGGTYSFLILGVAALALALIVERAFSLVVRLGVDGRVFIEEVIKLVRGGKVDDALKLCAQTHTAVSDIGLLILRSRTRDEEALGTLSTAASLSVMPRLTRRLAYLPMLANVATMLGLVGTLHRLSDAFAAAGGATPGDRGARLALGIAVALQPAALGIAAAIPMVAAHAYLVTKSEAIIEQLDEFSARLVNALTDRPDVRLGHR
jgi:biopolymer transport protein ExbB